MDNEKWIMDKAISRVLLPILVIICKLINYKLSITKSLAKLVENLEICKKRAVIIFQALEFVTQRGQFVKKYPSHSGPFAVFPYLCDGKMK